MHKHYQRLITLVILAFLISTACGISTQAVSNVPGWPETAAAQTWSVMQTSAFLSATPTFTPLPATDTPIPTDTPLATNTPTPTNTLIPVLTQRPTNTPTLTPTRTSVPPTATRIPSGGGSGGGGGGSGGGGGGGSSAPCYAAELVRDITIPNGQIMSPNTTFTKIWRIRNVGSCIWPSGSRMVPARNNLWNGTATTVGSQVRPGDNADYSVTLTSPTSGGTFTGDWLIRVDRNTQLGPRGDDAFQLRIQVASPLPTTLWNFVDNLCTARWRTGNNRDLNCPSNPTTRNAFVLRAAPATIDNSSSVPAVIWSQPNSSENASIVGTFPGLYIRGDERFRASGGCLRDFDRCHVRMNIYYRLLGGDDILIASREEVWDATHADHQLINGFSLAPFAGNYVTFILKVTAINDRDPSAAWFYVELYR